ncbi:MAG: hypothetical protein HOP15_14210 [Planctomycetes bacterium]|nr:hypothetical protein [Planctomycetota bacterium]
MNRNELSSLALLSVLAGCFSPPLQPTPPLELPGPVLHVILVSVDGLRPDAFDVLGPEQAPHFFRLRSEGASTANARTDPKLASTLPDHTSQLTSRPVFGSEGHGWILNTDPGSPSTIHILKGEYVPSVFDVVHDSGFSTALYASKDKFELLARSWGRFGAEDPTGIDNGHNKLDAVLIEGDVNALVQTFLEDFGASPVTCAFLHLREPDSTGHDSGWDLSPGSDYLEAVRAVDRAVGALMALVESSPLRDSTVLIVTADHAGDLGTDGHILLPDVGLYESGIIPFYVWGVTVTPGADLYALNTTTRADPGRTIPPMSRPLQPIRNGDAGNLALQLLGLPPIPGSTINARHDLSVTRALLSP